VPLYRSGSQKLTAFRMRFFGGLCDRGVASEVRYETPVCI
jgi:hypothetical protein